MNDEQAKKLRAPFKPEQIGKLPKPTKRENPKGKCAECGGWHGLPAVHLDYVGHAAITDRLLEVDPEWSWEPMASGPNGEPLFTNGGLWIKLTVCGVSRPGFGDETNGRGTKEVIGDALRNAAMRFGVGLDLWSKEKLHADDDEVSSNAPLSPAATPARQEGAATATAPSDPPKQKPQEAVSEEDLLLLVADKGGDVPAFKAALETARGTAEFPAWLEFQLGHWTKAKKPFTVPEKARAA